MSWFKVDDGFWGHPKRARCSLAAAGLWVVAGSWSADQLTDGLIPRHMLGMLGARLKEATELVEAGLWTDTDGGWQFSDWADYQPTRAQVEADREAARNRMKRARNGRRIRTEPTPEFDGSSPEHEANERRTSGDVRLTPSRPVPTRPDPSTYVELNQGGQRHETLGGSDATQPPRCVAHQGLPEDQVPPCRGCMVAAEKLGTASNIAAASQQLSTRLAIDNCGQCNDQGWLEDPETHDLIARCDHIHRQPGALAPARAATQPESRTA